MSLVCAYCFGEVLECLPYDGGWGYYCHDCADWCLVELRLPDDPTPRQVMAETRKELGCSFCRPHKGENAKSKKHGAQTPKKKTSTRKKRETK